MSLGMALGSPPKRDFTLREVQNRGVVGRRVYAFAAFVIGTVLRSCVRSSRYDRERTVPEGKGPF